LIRAVRLGGEPRKLAVDIALTDSGVADNRMGAASRKMLPARYGARY
jgi:hypothetical protein